MRVGLFTKRRVTYDVTVFILEQVPPGSVSEASRYRVLEAVLKMVPQLSHTLPILGRLGNNSYLTF